MAQPKVTLVKFIYRAQQPLPLFNSRVFLLGLYKSQVWPMNEKDLLGWQSVGH